MDPGVERRDVPETPHDIGRGVEDNLVRPVGRRGQEAGDGAEGGRLDLGNKERQSKESVRSVVFYALEAEEDGKDKFVACGKCLRSRRCHDNAPSQLTFTEVKDGRIVRPAKL